MDFSVTEQTYSFLFFCLLGFFNGIFYDFAKALRILLKADQKVTAMIDVLYLICTTVFFVRVLFRYNGLGIHVFQLIGAFLGLILYFNTLSPVFERIFKIILLILSKILKILLYPVAILCKIVNGVFLFIKKLFYQLWGVAKKSGKKTAAGLKKLNRRRKKV